SGAGQVLFLYARIPDATFDTSRTDFRRGLHEADTAFLVWISSTGRVRSVSSILIRRNGDYWARSYPRVDSGLNFVLPFGRGYFKLLYGRASTHDFDIFRDRIRWVQFIVPNWFLLTILGLFPAIFMIRPIARLLRIR